MSLVQKLLQTQPAQSLKAYQSIIQLHLKEILTTISKHKLQNLAQTKIRQSKCIVGCYEYYTQPNKRRSEDRDSLWERVEELRTCKEKCGGESKEVEKFLDNINFYSKKKFSNCSSSCLKMEGQEQRNMCLWECYNRLDRRYKQYWSDQKSNITAKYKI